MRNNFWCGVITGTVIGAIFSMIFGERRQERKGFISYNPKQVRSSANRVLRGVSRTVSDLIK